MLVSIIINNYNYGRFLRFAIDSALNQSYVTKEILVVDDGSKDDSREIIESYGSKVKAVFKTNGGQASAFNAGYLVSNGDLVLFLDSDDVLYPHAVAVVVKQWEEEYAKIHYSLEIIDEVGASTGVVRPKEPLAEGDITRELLTKGHYVTMPTTGNVFSRRFLSQIMPMPERPWVSHADCYLNHSAPFFGRIGAIRQTLGQYRVHDTTLSLSSRVHGGRIILDRLRSDLSRDLHRHQVIESFASLRGLRMTQESLFSTYGHYKLRLVSLKLDPLRHPFREDTLLKTASILLRKVWKEPAMSLRTRIVFALWVFLLVVARSPLSHRLAALAVAPEMRAPVLAQLGSFTYGSVGSGS